VTAVDSPAVVDLLGVLAYAELTAFDRLAEDARMAPTLGGRAALARMAAAEMAHHDRLAGRLRELGADPAAAMAPSCRRSTASTRAPGRGRGWRAWSRPTSGTGWRRLLPRDRRLPARAGPLAHPRRARRHRPRRLRRPRGARRDRLAAALAGRLALWGRRLVGEAISQSQAVIAERDGLAQLIMEGTGDLTGIALLVDRITAAHTERMRTLGLNP
jgi:hypothetical protein